MIFVDAFKWMASFEKLAYNDSLDMHLSLEITATYETGFLHNIKYHRDTENRETEMVIKGFFTF